jgi:hypothetical protein
VLLVPLILLSVIGCGADRPRSDRQADGGLTAITVTGGEPQQPDAGSAETPTVDDPPPDESVEDDSSPSRVERRVAARVAAIVGWKRSSGGTGSDSTDGPFWKGWITADGCQVKRLLVGRAAVERSLRDAPRRPVTRRYRRSWWTVTNPAGTVAFRGYGVQGQGTENWDTDCHRTLGAALAVVPGSL